MNKKQATRLAKKALRAVEVGSDVDVADCVVLVKNNDSFSVCDNGEEVVCRTESQVIEIICEDLK